MESIFMLWVMSCHVIFQTFPNFFLQDVTYAVSNKILNAIWPLDPNNACMYGNFQNLSKQIYFNAILQSIIIGVEVFLIIQVVSKIKKYLDKCSFSNHKYLKKIKIKKHLGKYVGISTMAIVVGQIAYLQLTEKTQRIKSEDKQTQDKYLKAYVLINSGDKAETHMNRDEAQKYYEEAYHDLLQIQKEKPDWEPTIVRYRLRYVREKLGISDSDP